MKVIIVDDEPHAREGIRLRLKDFPELNIISESDSGIDAANKINSLKPDIVFLDIQIPELNGFEVLQKINVKPMPQIIFITAFDQYAIKAFEYHALDYLLKPINELRFEKAVRNAIAKIRMNNLNIYSEKLIALIEQLNMDKSVGKTTENGGNFIDRLVIKAKENIVFISVDEIDWIESAGDYVYIHTNKKKYILRETLISIEQKLNPQTFVRIHRSTIVNIDKIEKMKSTDHGDYYVYLVEGEKLKLSRTYKSKFEEIIGHQL